MRKMFWAAILLGGILLMGTMVTAQEKRSETTVPQMQGMGLKMGMEMMGHGGQMGQMAPMMQMMQGMMEMMDNCNQMMGGSPSMEQGGKRK